MPGENSGLGGFLPVFWIRDILVRIRMRIRILGSVPLPFYFLEQDSDLYLRRPS